MDASQIDSILKWVSSRTDEFYEDAPCGFLFTLPDGLVIKANRTFLDWVEFDKDELFSKKRFQDLLTVGCKIYYETHYAPLLKIQSYLNEVTIDLRTRSGKAIPVLINSSEIRNDAGQVTLIRSTVFNISERRRYEKELLSARHRAENSERRFSFLASAGDILRSSHETHSNLGAFARLAIESFCDACTIDMVQDGALHRIGEAHRYDQAPPAPKFDVNSRTFAEPELLPDFEEVDASSPDFNPQSLLAVPIFREDKPVGRITFYMIELGRKFTEEDLELASEVSKRCSTAIENAELHLANVRSAEALRDSHEWLSTTLASIGDAVIAVGTDRKISFMNAIASELTGWTAEEANGRPMGEVFKIIHQGTGESAFNPVDRALHEGVIVLLEEHTALIRKDGTRKMIEDSTAPIKARDGTVIGAVLVFRDITEKYAQDQERLNTLKELQEERDVRERFVATLTHDLRSPITAVKMGAQLILRKTEDPAVVQAQAVRVINSVNRADQMIQDLLDANRIRAGEKIPLNISKCDFAAEVKEAIFDLVAIHGDRFVYDGEEELTGLWDCNAIRRVVENLCNNAVKYGAPRTLVGIRLKLTNEGALLDVHNFGNPIKPEDQVHLFEPYRRTLSAQTGGQKGWGLGLTLVRGVVEGHGGKVSVESSPEKGTKFSVLLPVRSPTEETEAR